MAVRSRPSRGMYGIDGNRSRGRRTKMKRGYTEVETSSEAGKERQKLGLNSLMKRTLTGRGNTHNLGEFEGTDSTTTSRSNGAFFIFLIVLV